MTTTAVPEVAPAHFRRDAAPGRHQRRRAAAIMELSQGLTGRALDYGAGWGDLTWKLAPQFDAIEGVDVSADRVAFAANEYAPIPFHQCAEEGLDYADASFDVLYSTVVIHFVPSPDRYLAECRRVVKPGGTMVIMLQSPDSMWMLGRQWRQGFVEPQNWGGNTLEDFRQWLRAGGFEPEQQAGFYDPAFDRAKTAGDMAISVMNAVGHLFSIEGRWSYVGFRCRRLP